MATLIITDDEGAKRTFELTDRDVRIGRSADNDLALGDATKGVSRMHAELRFEHGHYVVIDLNSQNGTWINGERVQRAEVPANGEIAIGAYRLRIQGAPSAEAVPEAAADTRIGSPVRAAASPSETVIAPAARAAAPPAPAAKGTKKTARQSGRADVQPGLIAALARLPKPMIFGGFFAIALVIIVLGQIFSPGDSSSTSKPADSAESAAAKAPAGESNAQIIARHLTEGKALVDKGEYEAAIRDHFDRVLLIDPNHPEASDLKARAQEKLQQALASAPAASAATSAPATSTPPAAGSPASTVPLPAGAATASTVPPPNKVAAAAPVSAPAATSSAPAAADATAAKKPAGSPAPARAANPGRGPSESDILVSRKPGESAQAWRARAVALQQRYAAAKTALDRGDFPAAATGFDAVLKEEPAFLDAPQLLIRAREGVRDAAREAARGAAKDAFDAGSKLEAASDWTGALQKYEQARQLDAGYAGLDDGLKRVREKMRVAGNDAFKRARQYDALGRPADALKAYEQAAELLPADDANRRVARDRADQLKLGGK